MTIESIWMIIVGISAPVAGVVAFYIQLKNLKTINLENEKLKLEINQLIEENQKLESKIKMPTDEEVKKYSRPEIMFSRRSQASIEKQPLFSKLLNIDWGSLLIALSIIIFIGYFFYDIFRVGAWLLGLF